MDLQTTDGTTSMCAVDGIGNPTAAITDAGAKAYEVHYDPYGTERITADDEANVQWQQNPYGFKTGLRSSSTENGLTKFGYRWQASGTGGWIERDALDAPLDPSNANRYAYAGADPVNTSDPTGRFSAEAQGVILGGLTTLFVGAVGCTLGPVGCAVGGYVGGVLGSGIGSAQTAYAKGENTQTAFYSGIQSGLITGLIPAVGGGIYGVKVS